MAAKDKKPRRKFDCFSSKTFITSVFVLFFPIVFSSCSSAPPLTEAEIKQRKKDVEIFFQTVRLAIKSGNGRAILNTLSENSLMWFQDMEDAVFSERVDNLKERPFFEILGILAIRVHQRHNSDFRVEPASILEKIVVNVSAVRKSFLNFPLGPYELDSDGAWVGLRKAPNNPVFYFTHERDNWKFDLVKSLPLILRGVESIALGEHEEPLKQSIYIIEKLMHTKVETSDLLL